MAHFHSQFNFEIPSQAVDNPGNWTRAELETQNWKATLDNALVDELLGAVTVLTDRGVMAPHFDRASFPVPLTADFLDTLSIQLEDQRGFVVIDGSPFSSLAQHEMETLFWGLGLHLGQSVPINAGGDLIGHVRDHGYDLQVDTVRNYQTAEELKLHNDTCDILGLMCVQPAKQGGDSAIASATAIHNEILTTRPDLLKALYTPLPIDRRGERGWPGEDNSRWFALPIFSYFSGRVTTRYTVHEYYYESQKFTDAPRITDLQAEALEYLRTTARDPRFHINFRLAPGDLQFVNNYCVLHARTHFEDYPEPARKRHLLRLWLSVPNSRPLHPVFARRFRSAEAGALRGGIAPSLQR